ncbi:hypothetical protein CCL15_22455 [Pseudomonas syringae]|jgi:hypothetical protein|nr:hypothetical protein CCL15_22455 [Pseudomonas syringae]
MIHWVPPDVFASTWARPEPPLEHFTGAVVKICPAGDMQHAARKALEAGFQSKRSWVKKKVYL